MIALLPYGRTPLRFDAGDRHIEVIRPVALSPAQPIADLLQDALATPIGSPALEQLARGTKRVTVIVSDTTRAEPRAAFLESVREHLADRTWTIAIATGTHGPCRVGELEVPIDLLDGATIVNHDGHDERDLVTVGTTARGTPVRVHRCVVDTDLVVATGCIRPHYFAGFGAGVKAIFPGLGQAAAIRINHRLKTEPGSRAGIVDGNPCRADLEDAVRVINTPTFLLNGVCGPDDDDDDDVRSSSHLVRAAVAGDHSLAFRAGTETARPWFTVSATPAPVVIASDALPVTASLYQAAKIAAAVAPFVMTDGVLVIVAECPDGVGPLEVVNEAILRIGILPRLPAHVKLVLVSSLDETVVRTTLVQHVASVEAILQSTTGRVLVVPRASQLLCAPT